MLTFKIMERKRELELLTVCIFQMFLLFVIHGQLKSNLYDSKAYFKNNKNYLYLQLCGFFSWGCFFFCFLNFVHYFAL